MASSFPPGWQAVLSLFVTMHIAPLANPLLTVALGVLLLVCLRHLEAPAPTSRALAALLTLSPFASFKGASLFSRMQAAVVVMAICLLQFRDEANERIGNNPLISFFLSVVTSDIVASPTPGRTFPHSIGHGSIVPPFRHRPRRAKFAAGRMIGGDRVSGWSERPIRAY